MYARRLDPSQYEPLLAEASAAAAALDIRLPSLPAPPNDRDRQAAVIEALRGTATDYAARFAERFTPADAALAELAIRSHLLLLVYLPRGDIAAAQAAAVRAAAEKSGLPASLWQPLVTLLEDRASFVAVRPAVFQLHRQVANYLSTAR
jgi:hypothetical protein